MSAIFTAAITHTLKKTIKNIVSDNEDGVEQDAIFPKYFDVEETDEAYVDDLEVAGPGLGSEVQEGAEVPLGQIREGVITRYIMRKIGLRLYISDEAVEDCKYPQILKGGKKLKRALWKTYDVDAAYALARAWDTNYPLGDGLPLCSASHTLPGGGTFSNTLAVPMSPSRAALIAIRPLVRKLPGHDGIIEGYKMRKIICPSEQVSSWEGIIKSQYAPEPGNFNEINVAYSMGLSIVEVPFWVNTTTNWIVKTDADNGLKWYWRRRPRASTYVENDNEVMIWHLSSRHSRGCSDARGVFGSQA